MEKFFQLIGRTFRILRTPVILVQLVALLFLFANEFGFDHPSKSGLDVGHFAIVLVIYVVAFVYGAIISFVRGNIALFVTQLSLLLVIAVLPWSDEPSGKTKASYRVADFQHIIDMNKEEVVQLLGQPIVSGRGKLDFYSYGNMTVYFSDEGKVVSLDSK